MLQHILIVKNNLLLLPSPMCTRFFFHFGNFSMLYHREITVVISLCLAAGCSPCRAGSPQQAEGQAILEALQRARSKGWKKILIHSDSLEWTKYISGSTQIP